MWTSNAAWLCWGLALLLGSVLGAAKVWSKARRM